MRRLAGHASAAGIAVLLAMAAGSGVAAQELPDAPDIRMAWTESHAPRPASYAEALARWKTVDDIARHAGAAFVYDRARALSLAESSTAAGATRRPAIHAPESFYAKPQGVCLDLARFGVETLDRIDPSAHARYLMLEFEPVVVEGAVLRRHWIASFQRDGAWWFFADSRRPGHVTGPYSTIEAFVAEYAAYRGRPIVAYRERDSLLRETRRVAQRKT